MGVCSVPIISTVCHVAGKAAATVVSAPFDWIAQGVGNAAEWMFKGVWQLFDSTTLVDVTDPNYLKVYDVLFGVAIFLMLLFFFLQLITGPIARDPRPAILVDKMEQLVADHYKTIQIPADIRKAMLGMLDEEFAALHASSETERHQLTVEKDRIQDQRRASLQAHYAGALPLDLLKEEQDRLARQLDLVTARLDALDSTYEEARTHLHECLALAGDCQTVYACGSDTTRRMANQAFFTRIYLDADDTIRTEPTRSFGLLLDRDTQHQALAWVDQRQNASKRPTRTLTHDVEGSSKTRGVDVKGLEPLTSRV